MNLRRVKQSLLWFLLLVTCGSALAQQRYEGQEPLLVWQRARQVQRDYIRYLKQQLAAAPNNQALQMDLGRAYHWLALEHEDVALVEEEKLLEQILAKEPAHAVALAYHGSLLGLKIGFNLVAT